MASHSPYDESLKYTFYHWNAVFLHPANFRKPYAVFVMLNWILIAYLTYLNLTQDNADLKIIADSIQTISLLLHVMTLWFLLITNHTKLRIILEKIKFFWIDVEFDHVLNSLNRALRLWIIYYVPAYICTATIPYFGYDLLTPCYKPDFLNYYVFITYVVVSFTVGVAMSIGITIFFVTIVVFLIVQFRIIRKRLYEIDYEKIATEKDERECLRKLKEIVDHHNFVITVCHEVSDIYGIPLVVWSGSITFTLCSAFYFFLQQSENDYGVLAKSAILIGGLFVEITFFCCIPAEHLIHEAEGVLSAIYMSNWYKCRSKPVKTALHIIMLRIQKKTALNSAGGFMEINLELCKAIFKNAFSFCTFLTKMKDK